MYFVVDAESMRDDMSSYLDEIGYSKENHEVWVGTRDHFDRERGRAASPSSAVQLGNKAVSSGKHVQTKFGPRSKMGDDDFFATSEFWTHFGE